MSTRKIESPLATLAALVLLTLAAAPAAAAFFTVSKVADTNDGLCDADCSLREAIVAANANGSALIDSIGFSITGAGPHTITVTTTALPTITTPVSIDGTGEAISGAPGVRLDGTGLASGNGLTFGATADGSSMAYLSITNFPGDGISILSDSTTVLLCYLGVAPDGTTAGGNGGEGIRINGLTTTVGSGAGLGNLISGNVSDGVFVGSGAGFSVIRGNKIGTNSAGTAALANGDAGIRSSSSSAITVGGNSAGQGNLISGNVGAGIDIASGTTFWGIQGNLIGLDAAGTSAVPNGTYGITTLGDNHLIGSTDPIGRNVISGNTSYGILLYVGSNAVDIYGNYIGTNQAGTASLGTQTGGIRVTGVVTNCIIGGTGSTYRNVISGNSSFGVSLESDTSGCVIEGNYIGLNAAGSGAVPNLTGVDLSGANNVVGGDTPGERNILSGNTNYGLLFRGATNKVQGNYIGTNPAGTAAIANGYGIRGLGATGGTIGGTNAGEGNLVSGNTNVAITLDGDTSGVSILGDNVGLNITATGAVANGSGIQIGGASHTVGGASAAARNLISGNLGGGVTASGTNQKVYGNFIGTNAFGTAAIANGGIGIYVTGGSGNQIGGINAGEGNLVSGNTGGAISVAGTASSIRGNSIGTNAAGTGAIANGSGVGLSGSNHVVGGSTAAARNLISGNTGGGIYVAGDNQIVTGNYIGTNAAGTSALANGGIGIYVASGSGDQIGGINPGEGNLVSGNTYGGISLAGSGSFVRGNKVGTNLAGTAAIANGGGINVYGSGHTIGGATAAARNLVSGNPGGGFYVTGSGHLISGNYVGVNAAGTAAIGNGSYGLRADTAVGVTVGGLTPAEGNVIAGNERSVNFGYGSHDNTVINNIIGLDATMTVNLADTGTGVEIGDSFDNNIGLPGVGNVIAGMTYQGIGISGAASTGNVIQGNWIGTNKALAAGLGNGFAGIFVIDSSDNTIGGTGAGQGNVIANNYQFGVRVERGDDNEISGNSIYGNFFGIDIDEIGFFPNDGGDGDEGGNQAQNYPLISSAMLDGPSTDVTGLLINEPNTQYRVEFFSSPSCNAVGFGDGKTFRGSTLVTTDGGGQAPLATTLPLAIPDPILTATVTDPSGNTSEFSPCAQIGLGPNAGKFNFDRPAYVGYEGVIPTTQVFVTRTLGLSGTATVAFATSNNSALAGSDYTDSDQTLSFGPWEVVKIVEVPILYDPALEPVPAPEKLNLALSAPGGGATLGAQANAEIQIWDYLTGDPGLTVSDAFVDEGNSGQKNMTFDVTLTATDHQVKVTYLAEAGSATEGVDYDYVEGVLTFPPSASTQVQQVQIPIHGDTAVEGDEIVWLRITTAAAGGNWIAYDVYGRGEIRNDDFSSPAPPNVIFADSVETGSTALWSKTTP